MKLPVVSLRVLLPCAVAAFALALLSGMLWQSLLSARPQVLAQTTSEVRATGAELQRDLDRFGRQAEPEGTAGAVRWAAMHERAAESALVGADGTVLAASRAEWVGRPAGEVLPGALAPPRTLPQPRVESAPASDLVVGFFPIDLDGRGQARSQGVLVFALDAGRPVAVARADAWGRFRVLALGALVLAVLLGLALDRLVSRRVGALQATVARIATGDFTARPPVTRGDELGALARGLEVMTDRLAAASAERDRANRLLQIQNEVLAAVAEDRALGSALDRLCALVELTVERSLCSVMELTASGGLRVVAGPSIGPDVRARLDGLVPGPQSGSCGTAAHTGRAVFVSDTQTDPRWEGMRAAAEELGIRACWSVPILDGDAVYGTFAISHLVPGEPDDRDRELLAASARLAGIAVRRTRTQQALRDGEERLRLLTETIDEVFWMTTPELDRMLYVSPAYERVWGRTRESLYADPWSFLDAIHPDDRGELLAAISPRDGSPFRAEYRVVRPDGTVCWVEDRGFPVRDGDGGLRAMVGCVRDITEQKRAEQALKAREARFRAVVETNPDGFWMVDAQGRFAEVNEVYERRSGYTRAELLGMRIADVEAKEDSAAVEAHIAVIRRDGYDRFESLHRAKDGTVWPVEVTAAFWPETGGTFAFLKDITDRKRAEALLQRANELLQAVADGAPDAIFVKDRAGKYLLFNEAAAQFVGKPVADVLGRDDTELFARDSARAVMANDRRVMATGAVEVNEETLTAAGVTRTYLAKKAPYRDATGAVVGVVGVATDITDRKRTETALRESEERFRTVVESVPTGLLAIDADGRVTLVNQRILEWFGYDRADLIGRAVEDLVPVRFRQTHPDDRRRYTAAPVARPMGTNRDLFGVRKDGTEFPVEIGLVPMVSSAGPLVLAAVADITERKRAESALRESEARYRTVIDRAVDPLFVTDLSGRFVDINQTACETLGYTRDELLELGIPDIDPDYPPERVAAALARFVAASGQMVTFETRHRRKDGTVFPVEMRVGAVQLGDTLRIVGLAHDLTRRKQAEAEIRALNTDLERRVAERTAELSRLVTILEASPDLIAIFDESSERAIYTNGAFRLRAEALGLALEDIRIGTVHSPESARRVHEEGVPAAVRNGIWLGETDILGPGGRLIPVSELIQTHKGRDGQTRYVSTIMRDISDRKRMEDELRHRRDALLLANADLAKASRLKDEFLASMSHELRTPLNGVLAMSEALQEEVYGPVSAPQVSALRDIEQCGRHLLALINDILDLSKIEAGQITLELGSVDVDGLCQAALRLVKEMAQKKRHRVSLNLDGAVGTIAADERRLKQVLVNLLSNAVKFTPDGGAVGLEVRGDEARGAVTFTVTDTGIGIRQEDIGLLFRPFQQIDSRLSREYAGTGLGLALVRRMTELHGGSVTVESAPGQGSRFSAHLPWHPAGRAPEPESADARPGRVRKVLLVEDSPGDVEKLERYLADLNVEAVVHPGASGALDRIRGERPDVVLLDLLLPDGDGWAILTALKADPELRAVPVIVLSVVDDQSRCLALGAAAHLVKPVDRETLRSALQQAVRVVEGSRAVVVLPELPGPSAPLLLMAEDNPVNARGVRDYLQAAGYRVTVAPNGFQALELARHSHPALILMDIQMPGIDGLEVIRRLRADDATRHIPIVAVTALAMPGDRERCTAAGADDYLMKPLSLRQLLTLVGRHVPLSGTADAPSSDLP